MNLKTLKIRFLAGMGGILLIFLIWFLGIRLEGTPPLVKTSGISDGIRASHEISISASDEKSGLRKVLVFLERDGKKTAVLEKVFSSTGFFGTGETKSGNIDLKIEPKKLGLEDGKTVFQIIVQDYSWRSWWHGNKSEIIRDVYIDTRPPRITVLSQQHNISQGGAGLVIYRLSEPCPVSGVRVGNNFFPGRSAAKLEDIKDENVYLCFIALDYTQGSGTSLVIEAEDRAGNLVKAGFSHYIGNRKFKEDVLNISDTFLNEKMSEFDEMLEKTDISPLEKFLEVNRKFRVVNTEHFIKLGEQTENILYWQEFFLRMPGTAPQAGFADHREYRYNGQKIDAQVHLGVDLASLAQAPIPAANNGKVVFTGYVGIYGETVMIDHGFGVFSLYSHLSSIDVKPGQTVSRGDIIGRTGTTGMAGGDHLHFGMLVHNTFVNPLEWWDPAWIKNHINLKIKEIKGNKTDRRSTR
ncbi:MAG: M23 family metallopeptidase [Desulfococcaceae bacterium]